jgi:hypothetical protein
MRAVAMTMSLLNLRQRLDPIRVRRVDVELTLEEFFSLFKRFNVVLSRRGLSLIDREYQWDE